MRLETIREKLNELKELDKGYEIFGSESHQYLLNPTLSEEQITAFEEKSSIRLPEEYREYLLRIGNGGAGPFYGLYKLGKGDGIEIDTSKPFPLSSNERLKVFDVYAQMEERLAELNIEDEDEADEMRDTLFNEICGDIDCGFVFLCTEGCGMDSILIVNGEAYGTVWYHDMANDAGIFPMENPATNEPMTFFEWFEIWLDTSIESFKSGTEPISRYSHYIQWEEETDAQADFTQNLCHMQVIKLSHKVTMEMVMLYVDSSNLRMFAVNQFTRKQAVLAFNEQNELEEYMQNLQESCALKNIAFEVIGNDETATEPEEETSKRHDNVDVLELFAEGEQTCFEEKFIADNTCIPCERWHYFSDEYDEPFYKILCDTRGMSVIITTIWPHMEEFYWQAENEENLNEIIDDLRNQFESGDYELVKHEKLDYPFEAALEQAKQIFEAFTVQREMMKQYEDNN